MNSATEARIYKEIIVDKLMAHEPIGSEDEFDTAKPILRDLVDELEEEGYLEEEVKPIVHKVVDRMTETKAEEKRKSQSQQEKEEKEDIEESADEGTYEIEDESDSLDENAMDRLENLAKDMICSLDQFSDDRPHFCPIIA